jgi:regulator of protease activity HflC (stomatin/prohibitin superfamily)
MKKMLLLLCVVTLFSSCAVIRPGEAGIKQRLGNLDDKVVTQGTIVYNPFTTRVIKESIRTRNLLLDLRLPSKEGLSVESQISILYRLEKDRVPEILEEIGPEYEEVIKSVFRSASADVCAQFFAKDMHSGKRADIEQAIQEKITSTLKPQGIVIEAVLMKSISLPEGLSRSIEQKLQAEQDALRMEFVLQRERQEAERKIIEAEGTRDAQKILAEGLSSEILNLRSIEAFLKLAASPNAKIIITDGKTPYLINSEK